MSFVNHPGLYIHIPFCKTKCPYCDFYSIASPELIPNFLEALEKEALLYKDSFTSFDSFYLGGGTPSLLTRGQLDRLMKNLRRTFIFAPDSEITIEANPDDVTPEKLSLWRDLGVNRLSLGVQSFNEEELRFLGRRHTARQTTQALELIRAAGFQNLGLDLMYGLPGQRLESWLKTLEQALSHQPEHLSCYQLTLAPETPFGRLAARGKVTPLDEEAARAFFLETSRYLTARGYLHYEVSNFARGEAHLCRHNRKYWQHAPYLGLGPGAHSFDGARRWWNFLSVAQYGATLTAGKAPVAARETLTPEQRRLEVLLLGFRTREGVALDAIAHRPGWEKVLAELTASGLARVSRGRVLPTLEGLAVADQLPLCFPD
jgi:oxygen-independent coproporphyrinogen-3 oxidase